MRGFFVHAGSVMRPAALRRVLQARRRKRTSCLGDAARCVAASEGRLLGVGLADLGLRVLEDQPQTSARPGNIPDRWWPRRCGCCVADQSAVYKLGVGSAALGFFLGELRIGNFSCSTFCCLLPSTRLLLPSRFVLDGSVLQVRDEYDGQDDQSPCDDRADDKHRGEIEHASAEFEVLVDVVGTDRGSDPDERDADRPHDGAKWPLLAVHEPDVGLCFEEAMVRRIDDVRELIVEGTPDRLELHVARSATDQQEEERADATPQHREDAVERDHDELGQGPEQPSLAERALIHRLLPEPEVREPPPELREPRPPLDGRLLGEERAWHIDHVFGDMLELQHIRRDAGRHAVGEGCDVLLRLVVDERVEELGVSHLLVIEVRPHDESVDAVQAGLIEAEILDKGAERDESPFDLHEHAIHFPSDEQEHTSVVDRHLVLVTQIRDRGGGQAPAHADVRRIGSHGFHEKLEGLGLRPALGEGEVRKRLTAPHDDSRSWRRSYRDDRHSHCCGLCRYRSRNHRSRGRDRSIHPTSIRTDVRDRAGRRFGHVNGNSVTGALAHGSLATSASFISSHSKTPFKNPDAELRQDNISLPDSFFVVNNKTRPH